MGSAPILSLLALGPFLTAETDGVKPKAEATVTVTAEATPVEVVRTPNPVRIVDAEELARLQARTLADLMAAIAPGAVMNTGGPGKQASAFLNGTLSRNVVILLDGVRLNDPTDVSPNLGSIGLVGIERVELLLGPNSVLNGSDAIGGVIHLRSASAPENGTHGALEVRDGSRTSDAASLALRFKGDAGWLAAGAEASRLDGDFPNDAMRQAGAFLRAGRRFGGLDLTLHYRNSGQTATIPFDVQYLPPAYSPKRVYVADRETRARQEHWGLSARWEPAKNLVLENTLGVGEGSTGDPAGRGRAQRDRAYRRVEDTFGFHWTPSAALRLSGRLEGREDRSDAKNYYDPTSFSTVQYSGEGRDLAGALELRWALAENLDWVSGLRHEGSHRDLTRAATGTRSRAGQAEATTFKTGLNWILSPTLRVYAGFGQGFRMPNLIEFTLNAQASVVDRTDYVLTPERSRTWQAGVTGRFAERFEYRVEAQRTRISNLLAYRYDGTFSGLFTDHYENAGAIRSQSLEGALGWKGGDAVVYGWDLVLRSAETRDLDHDADGQRYGQRNTAIVRHPFFTASVAGFLQAGPVRCDLRYDRVGSRYDLQDVPSFKVISTRKPHQELAASAAYALSKSLTFTLRGEHLLQPKQDVDGWLAGRWNRDGDATLVYGYPAPSRRVSLSATYRW